MPLKKSQNIFRYIVRTIIPTVSQRKNIQNQKIHQKSILYRWLKFRLSSSLTLGILPTVFIAIPALSAENLTIYLSPLELKIPIESLEKFAKKGELTPEFAFYAQLLQPEEKKELQELLQKRFDVNPKIVQAFIEEPVGEELLKRLGKILQTGDNQNGGEALKIAFNQAVTDSEGLTIVNLLKKFPGDIFIDIERSVNLTKELLEKFVENRLVLAELQNQAYNLDSAEENINVNSLPDLRKFGSFRWEKQSLNFRNPNRGRSSPADIYLPNISGNELIPLIVISHGLGSDRNSFLYLAEHLVSHGFAVVVPEHIGSSAEKIKDIFAGFTKPVDGTEFINRPLDIKYLLDELETQFSSDPKWQGRLNFQEVGVVGQSFGGYTALSLAGAPIDLEQLRIDCKSEDTKFIFNLSLLLQCQTSNLPEVTYNLRDERVKAAIAVNPVSSSIFGTEGKGISEIEIPMMIVASTEDIFAPPISEQIYPFMRLTTPEKYLVISKPATHFSFIQEEAEASVELPKELIGPNPKLAYPYLQVLSLAFFQIYVHNQPKLLSYLTNYYMQNLTQEGFVFSLLKSLTESDLEEAINNSVNRVKIEL
ncbi:MAG: alpha/beta hydrolase [Microcoleaceae cyanobacterium MO_207.B10]|nr:alpha/beta hydrolase [Microcoleaceae cyanobacterium MO_207.B10]